eukprot:13752001-Heterocapsa_arctica.AAC.1
MVADMHTPTWFAVGKTAINPDTSVVHAIRGARQGCTLGAIIVNITYEFALAAVRNKAAQEYLTYELNWDPNCPPWACGQEPQNNFGPNTT